MSGIYRGPNGSATADALNIDGDKGDLTISNSGLEWNINPDVVDFSKIQNIATDTVLGRATAGSGNVEEITCTAAGRALLDDASASAQRTTLGLGNAATATIGTEVLAYDSNLQAFVNTFTLPTVDTTNGFVLTTNGAGTLSLNAPGGISDGDKGDITVATGGTVWTIDNGAITTTKIADDNVTYAKIQNVSASDKLLGRSTAGAGDIEEITCTSAGRALLDDADASAQRTTLGLGSLATLSAITNAELDNQYIDDLTAVTAVSGDYVAIADASDGGNKKKTLVSDIVALATTTFASSAEIKTGTEATKAIAPNNLLAAMGFTAKYESTGQTITAGGALTLAHGLGRKPQLIQCYLKCTTANLGYSVGDEVFIPNMVPYSTSSAGQIVVPDTTNLNIRFGSYVSIYVILNKGTGTIADITPSSWKFYIKAWA